MEDEDLQVVNAPPSFEELDDSFAIDEEVAVEEEPPSYLDVWKQKLNLNKDVFAHVFTEVHNFHKEHGVGATLGFESFVDLVHSANMQYETEEDLHNLFNFLDIDGNGDLEDVEMLTGLSMLLVDTPLEERLKFTFTSFDLDGNGSIDKEELFQLLMAVSNSLNKKFASQEHMVRDRVNNIFEKYDTNKNDLLSFEEFSSAASRDGELGTIFSLGSLVI